MLTETDPWQQSVRYFKQVEVIYAYSDAGVAVMNTNIHGEVRIKVILLKLVIRNYTLLPM